MNPKAFFKALIFLKACQEKQPLFIGLDLDSGLTASCSRCKSWASDFIDLGYMKLQLYSASRLYKQV